MSTRSAIITKTKDGYSGVYCHWDGHLEGVGHTLRDHYTNDAKVQALLSLGEISILDNDVSPDPSKAHTFSCRQDGVTLAYHRDRSDPYHAAIAAKTAAGVARKIGHDGHVYVWNGKRWTHNGKAIK